VTCDMKNANTILLVLVTGHLPPVTGL
jgi:hypothetical protein